MKLVPAPIRIAPSTTTPRTRLMKSILLLIFLLQVTLIQAESRTWTSRDGRTVSAELVAVDAGTVTIRTAEGKTFTLQRTALSDQDQAFLQSATPPPAKEGKISFDEGGATLSQITGNQVILSGTCDLEGAAVTLAGSVNGTAKVTQGRWQIPIADLETWAKGTASFTVSAEGAGAKASTTMTLDFINLLDEGAKGDGTTDDTQAINAAAKKAASAENGILFVPSGHTFVHSALVVLDGVEMLGCGETSLLLATNPNKSVIVLRGEGPRLRNLAVEVRLGDTKRQTGPDQQKVWIDGASSFWVDAVHVKNSASAGIFNRGGVGSPERYSRITRCLVENTLADGIHNTGNAHHVLVEGNTAKNTGDDCFAVVSYKETLCHDIIIRHNKGSIGNARGITVVGGADVLIESNEIADKDAAGILIASEESYQTNLVERVTVRNNRISGCPAKITAQGGIYIGGRTGFPVTAVLLEGNQIKDSPAPGIRLGSISQQITLRGNQITNSKGSGVFLRASRDVVIEGNSIESSGSSGIFVDSTAGGSCLILNNQITGANLDDEPENAMIRVAESASLTKVEIADNRFKAGNGRVRQEIVCDIKGAVIRKNR